MRAEEDRSRGGNARVVDPHQVSHLLLCPGLNHLTGILLAVSLSEPELSTHISVSVFEDQNARLENFYRHAVTSLLRLSEAVVNIGLLPCGDTAVNLRYESFVEELEENHPGPGVHHLLHRGAVRLVPHLPRTLLHVVLPNVDLPCELLQDLLIGLVVI